MGRVMSADPTRWFLGVDVGGTFTDVVLADTRGGVDVIKVRTTPEDQREGVAEGVAALLAAHRVDPASVVRLVHGTTLATNVILEQRGTDIAFVTSRGFGDLLRLGREFRQEDERFDLFFRTPAPPVPQSRTFEVDERIDAAGRVLVPLDPAQVERVAAEVAGSGAAAVAICLLHAYAHPAHEEVVAEACRSAMAATAYVVTSSEVWPEMREYERAMTTVMCAYVGPVMSGYLAGLGTRLDALGIRCPIEVMESSGGVMSAALAARRPIATVESGGAAGVIAAGFVGRLIDVDEVISFDMGGTTAKTGVVRRGRPDITHDFHVGGIGSAGGARPGSGYPVKIPVVDLAEVGAGGGSIAWVDPGGALRVGPRSSGSVPGPAGYGLGGTEATVTDANLVLGYLRPGNLSGGVSLDPELSEKAIRQAVAGPLGLGVTGAARAIHDVANASMAAAIRVVTVQRGIDPRSFTLVGFGGAGPMHAAELAETFGITNVVIPRAAGVASAVGLVTADLAADRILTRLMPADTADPAEVAAIFARLEAEAVAELPGGDGELVVSRAVDVRFRGQAHQLTVPAPTEPVTRHTLEVVAAAFVRQYHETYGIEMEGPQELVSFRARVLRTVEKFAPVPHPDDGPVAAPEPAARRTVTFAGSVVDACPVYLWSDLGPGSTLAGPAIIEGLDTTVVTPPSHGAAIDPWGNVVLTRVAAGT
jgi:N-methylhydantoinase A